MTKTTSSENNAISTMGSVLPTPSLQQILNIYSAYNYAGSKAAFLMGATSLADGVLVHNYGTEKNYVSLSAFWGNVAYQAIQKISLSDKIPNQYKIPAQVFCALAALGLVWKGNDIFANKHNTQETLDKILLATTIFDRDKSIEHIQQSFSKSYYDGAAATLSNIPSLMSNKFVYSSFAKQGVGILQLVIMEKLFSSILPTNKLTIFKAYQDGSVKSLIIRNIVLKIATQIQNKIFDYVNEKIDSITKNDLAERIPALVLKSENSQKIMHIESKKIASFPYDVSNVVTNANNESGNLLKDMILPLIYSSNTIGAVNVPDLIKSYPLLVLLENTCSQLLSQNNMFLIEAYCESLLGIQNNNQENPLEEHQETQFQNIGQLQISIKTNIKDYTYTSIQDIVRSGGNQFILSKVLQYIELERQYKDPNDSNSSSFLDAVRAELGNVLFAMLLPMLGIESSDKVLLLEHSMNILVQTIMQNSSAGASNIMTWGLTSTSLQEIELIYRMLQSEENNFNASRQLSDSIKLELKDYAISKVAAKQTMLEGINISFENGKFYVVHGPIGTGKTTLLSDIAKCLNSAFKSEGEIFYPAYNQQEIARIFTGTELFAPPSVTLFEMLTYRLPADYITSEKDALEDSCIKLFKDLGQNFSKDDLLKKKSDGGVQLSTGQGKLVTIISAILYKEYLKEQNPEHNEVLFVIDETLTNLDYDTLQKVHAKVKQMFSDSIVIAVDHNWQQYYNKSEDSFYDQVIDLDFFAPKQDEVAEQEVLIAGGGIDDC